MVPVTYLEEFCNKNQEIHYNVLIWFLSYIYITKIRRIIFS